MQVMITVVHSQLAHSLTFDPSPGRVVMITVIHSQLAHSLTFDPSPVIVMITVIRKLIGPITHI